MGPVNDDVNWETFGFPKLEFLPSYLPYAGLCEALWERKKINATDPVNPDNGETEKPKNPYLPALLAVCSGGRENAVSFDRHLRDVAGLYINHLEADFETLTEIPFWSIESLCEALKERLVDPESDQMLPEWPVKWALQRYRMINLLKFAKIDYQCFFLSGSEHTGEPMSPEAAIEAAMSGVSPQGPVKNASISRTTTTIWGPDHGWKEGSYCADVYQCGNLSAVLPDELKGTDVRLYLSVDSPDGDPENFDSCGTRLIRGMNILYADSDGNFTTEWSLPGMPDRTRVPVKGRTERFGFVARGIFCCADFSTTFHFINKDDE